LTRLHSAAPLVFNQVYPATVDRRPAAVFAVAAGLSLSGLVLSLAVVRGGELYRQPPAPRVFQPLLVQADGEEAD
jgi:hypothetical protein